MNMLVLWFVMSWRPVVPEADWLFDRVLAYISVMGCVFVCSQDAECDTAVVSGASGCSGALSNILSGFMWMWRKLKGSNTWWQKHKVRPFAKIHISFFQIVGTFDMFAIVWSVFFTSAISWVEGTFQFDPSVSCSWMGVAFETILRSYTLALLVLIGMLALPVVAARFRGLHLTDKKRE